MRVYHYLEAKWALDDIRRRRLKLSKIDDMNDPYEWRGVRLDDKVSRSALAGTGEYLKATNGVVCFSLSWNNILMWSHYGDRHKGICLGFDVPDDDVGKVEYVKNMLVAGDLQKASEEERSRIMEALFWVKYDGWSYEDEVRIHATREERNEETGAYFVNFDENLRLKEIIAGARFSMTKGPIVDAIKGYSDDVKIVKARRSEQKFEIVVDEGGFDRQVEQELLKPLT